MDGRGVVGHGKERLPRAEKSCNYFPIPNVLSVNICYTYINKGRGKGNQK